MLPMVLAFIPHLTLSRLVEVRAGWKGQRHEVEKREASHVSLSTSGFEPGTGLLVEGRPAAQSGSGSVLTLAHLNSRPAAVCGSDFRLSVTCGPARALT